MSIEKTYTDTVFIDCIARGNPEKQIIEDFLLDCKVRNFSPRTMQSYKSHIKYFLSRHPIKSSVQDYKDFLVHIRDEKNYAPSTVGNYFASLCTFYDFLEWEEVVNRNIIPAFRKRYLRYYKTPRSEERQLINIEQMRDLVDAPSWIGYKAMFLFFAKTGIRRQELIDLDREDLNLAKNYVILKPHPKRTNRTVFFDEECKQVLKQYLKWKHNHEIKNPALFVGKQGRRITKDTIYEVTIEYAKKCGFHNPDPEGPLCERFTPHCFRHFFTTWLRRSGCPRGIIQELRGDIRKEAIDIYDHITIDEISEAYMRYMPKLGIK